MSETLTRERRLEIAGEVVGAAMKERAREFNARKPDPRSIADYTAWRTMGLVCVQVMKHSDRAASIECSRDGDAAGRIFLPTSKSIVQSDSVGDFLLICVPKWLAVKTELIGVTPDLSEARVWTKADVAAWNSLRNTRMSINTRIQRKHHKSTSNISRSNAA